ncbi:MAG: MotA/TolQ/ExbB proton channel family protein [Candidatus Eiseniibacteriota bacterium]|jgi:biopolymer transport protein ExbB
MSYRKRRHELTRLGLVLSVGLLLLAPVMGYTQEEGGEEVDPEAALEEQLGLVPTLPLETDENFDQIPESGGVSARAIELFEQGGVFMYPLLLCSIIGLALILERLWTLQRARVNTRKLMDRLLGAMRDNGVDAAIEVCTRTRGPIAAILHSGLMRADKGPEAVEKAIESAGVIEMSYLQRSMVWLATISTIAPLLGFLGTVSGMINAFAAIAAAEQVSAKLVASGIQEALITTATGLAIAIPIQLAHNYFVSKIDKFITEMEEASVEVVDTLVDMEHQQAQKRA